MFNPYHRITAMLATLVTLVTVLLWTVTARGAAPEALLANAVRCACITDPDPGCAAERGDEVRKMAAELYAVGLDLTEEHELPPWAAWWPVAQACRESNFRRDAVGDEGRSIGPLQAQQWLVDYWLRKTGTTLDRTDPSTTARALLQVVAWSYWSRADQVCGPSASRLMRFRLAAARVGRGPLKPSGSKRCDFWVWSMEHQEWRETAGIPAVWAKRWKMEAETVE